MRRGTIVPLLAAASLSLAALAPASAGARSVPHGWVGTDADGPLVDEDTSLFASQLKPMLQAGVESIRMTFDWRRIQPYPNMDAVPEPVRGQYRIVNGTPTRFDLTDSWVAGAALRGLRVLPVLTYAPSWAARHPGNAASPPRDPNDYARFAIALVGRYGSNGSFWSEHPEVPKIPILRWQLWNEPHLPGYWSDNKGWAADYVKLLKRAYKAIHDTDPAARVVLAGLTNRSWDALDELYRAGARGWFDYVAVHPFTKEVDGVVTIIENVRKVMMFNDDSGRHLFVTEMSWPSSLNKTQRQYGFEETEKGQAKKLAAAYKLLAQERKRLKINGVYWYTWLTTDTARVESFNYAGVVKYQQGKVTRKPAYAAMRDATLPLEGCAAKSTDAGTCSKKLRR